MTIWVSAVVKRTVVSELPCELVSCPFLGLPSPDDHTHSEKLTLLGKNVFHQKTAKSNVFQVLRYSSKCIMFNLPILIQMHSDTKSNLLTFSCHLDILIPHAVIKHVIIH